MEEVMIEDRENSPRSSKRMRNSTLNQETLMNPHNIRIQPPNNMVNNEVTVMDQHNTAMMVTDNSAARFHAPINDRIGDPTQETKVKTDKTLRLSKSLNFPNSAFEPSIGLSGGLLILWKDGFGLEIVHSSKNMIHCLVKNDPSKPEWILSLVYGSCKPQQKKVQWSFIRELGLEVDQPWVLVGDLNVILDPSDRVGINGASSSTSSSVIQCIQEAGLVDLTYNDIFGNIDTNIRQLHSKLDCLHQQACHKDNTSNILEVEAEIHKWEDIKKEFWQQKNKDNFFKEADNNTKFHHANANRRRSSNIIDALQNKNGL
ncbi:uncharacterized protein LOC113342847 [Papaver somniferum]|uniref:uncharacterized protein LOC113342847 n=1 Tax=Papaver somniferum TaxID=3469 RepID=UPI000E700DB7|nr:uncharacterized protein LOC113342847 [Papaver somniferum]